MGSIPKILKQIQDDRNQPLASQKKVHQTIPVPLNLISAMNQETQTWNNTHSKEDKAIFDLLAKEIDKGLPEAENKVWHGHPVWFLNGNPITGYSKQKKGIRLMFWSGMDFEEGQLQPGTGNFKDASAFYNSIEEIDTEDLKRWLAKGREIQWDYKNIVKNRGRLDRIK